MAPPAENRRSFRLFPILLAVIVVVVLAAGVYYLNQPPKPAQEPPLTPEAKAYVHDLKLSNVTMKASENLMNQRLVEINGDLTNTGPRTLRSVDVYCLFRGVDGREVYRERVLMIPPGAPPLKPSETRHFRLPFDTLPDSWNQALPDLVIAGIQFAQ